MSGNQEFPSLPEQGRNFVNMLRDIGMDTLKGKELFVSDFEQQRRYDMCQACESFDRVRKRCKECGCFMKQKTAFSASECPLKKW